MVTLPLVTSPVGRRSPQRLRLRGSRELAAYGAECAGRVWLPDRQDVPARLAGIHPGTRVQGRSSFREHRPATGDRRCERSGSRPARCFSSISWSPSTLGKVSSTGAGQLIQLTWQTNVGFVYDLNSFKPVRQFAYSGEGWGLTHDGKRLIMSDGSPSGQLRYLDPASLKELSRITIRDQGRPVAMLNELEFVRGEIFANIYQTDRVAQDRPRKRTRHRLDRSVRPAVSRRTPRHRRAERHCLRPGWRSAVRNRQALAAAVRDQVGEKAQVAKHLPMFTMNREEPAS